MDQDINEFLENETCQTTKNTSLKKMNSPSTIMLRTKPKDLHGPLSEEKNTSCVS
jgi:hypothetical protein